jgi:hypothetical protein
LQLRGFYIGNAHFKKASNRFRFSFIDPCGKTNLSKSVTTHRYFFSDESSLSLIGKKCLSCKGLNTTVMASWIVVNAVTARYRYSERSYPKLFAFGVLPWKRIRFG